MLVSQCAHHFLGPYPGALDERSPFAMRMSRESLKNAERRRPRKRIEPRLPYNVADEVGFLAGTEDRAGARGRRGIDLLRATGVKDGRENVRVRAVAPVG